MQIKLQCDATVHPLEYKKIKDRKYQVLPENVEQLNSLKMLWIPYLGIYPIEIQTLNGHGRIVIAELFVIPASRYDPSVIEWINKL